MRLLSILRVRLGLLVSLTSYNSVWDKYVKEVIARGKVVEGNSPCTVTVELDGKQQCIWVANWPYSSIYPYEPELKVRPSINTMLDFREWLVEQRLSL